MMAADAIDQWLRESIPQRLACAIWFATGCAVAFTLSLLVVAP